MTAAERLHSEGKLEGQRSLFLRLLRRRFGTIGAEGEAKVLAADEAWVDRALGADSIDDLFAQDA